MGEAMNTIRMLLFDIDGVITDGKKYIGENGLESKSINLKDMDALGMIKNAGFMIGCVSGEETDFSRQFVSMRILDYAKIGCKQKEEVLKEIEDRYHIFPSEICYIGDGKYDIPVLERVGLAFCPSDAIEEVRKISDIVLKRRGGEGCIAEIYTLLSFETKKETLERADGNLKKCILNRMIEHRDVSKAVMEDSVYVHNIQKAASMIIDSYRKKGHLFLCGNGGSAADAQHLAAELVGRFYLERKALSAEALTANSSILTSLSNDYEYDVVFARQLEAKAISKDVLIGITTSGTSENILQAFIKAKEMDIATILMTGGVSKYLPILKYTDCILAVPSQDVPRIQEMHILTGHIICEIVEEALA